MLTKIFILQLSLQKKTTCINQTSEAEETSSGQKQHCGTKNSIAKKIKVFIRDIMDLNLDNSTLNFHWSDKEVYWASFSHKSKLETSEHLFYKGFLNGRGARQGERCLVRVKKDDCGEKAYWRRHFQIVDLLHQITDLFNKSVLNEDYLKVITPHLAQIDNVSSFNKICTWNGVKEFGCEEFVVVEEYLNDMEEFMYENDNSNLVALFEALSHYTFIAMREELIFCNFQGEIRNSKECYLTCSTVHSKKHEFQDWGDEGIVGIKKFFSKHKCNKWCQKIWSNTDNKKIEQMEIKTKCYS